jgi:hypothetical protein
VAARAISISVAIGVLSVLASADVHLREIFANPKL